jgi:hypothetical protein
MDNIMSCVAIKHESKKQSCEVLTALAATPPPSQSCPMRQYRKIGHENG